MRRIQVVTGLIADVSDHYTIKARFWVSIEAKIKRKRTIKNKGNKTYSKSSKNVTSIDSFYSTKWQFLVGKGHGRMKGVFDRRRQGYRDLLCWLRSASF